MAPSTGARSPPNAKAGRAPPDSPNGRAVRFRDAL
jgi:hypothetical protein